MARLNLAILGALLVGLPAWADHFTVELEVQAGKSKLIAKTESAVLGSAPKQRGVLRVKAGERITARWTVRNLSANQAVKDVQVHFFAAREKELGQKTLPRLKDDAAAQNAVLMDFDPKGNYDGDLTFAIGKSGPYLLRVETKGAARGPDGHEHFAALELLVQE
jgi:hypothetical protein